MLTVLLISKVSSREMLLVRVIVSLLPAALIASSSESKNLFPILALTLSLAYT